MFDEIVIQNAHMNNLKNVTVRIPKNKLVVITGLSGSGKSTLAFDILHKEGQRQYMESMGLVTDYLSKPKVDSITGLSPTISVDQHLTNRSPRSTVGTETEIYTYLRVLFAKLGHRTCTGCGADVPPPFSTEGLEEMEEEGGEPGEGSFYPCPACGRKLEELTMAHFSFNKLAGACPACTGLGVVNQVDMKALLDEEKSILEGGVSGWDVHIIERCSLAFTEAGKYYGFEFDISKPIKEYTQVQRDYLLYGVGSPMFKRHFPGIPAPTSYRKGSFEGIETNFLRRYAERIEDAKYRERMEKNMIQQICPQCQGLRLKEESRNVTVTGRTIVDLSQMPLVELDLWLKGLANEMPAEAQAIVQPILDDLSQRVKRVVNTGLGYLSMDRSSPTLSAGEAQRLRLASLIGSGLSGVIYVLDEPSMGLHQRDTGMLIRMLKKLRDLGNTVVVIEHDMEVMQAADHIIDIGPGAGQFGGSVVASGSVREIAAVEVSETGRFLSGRSCVPIPSIRRKGAGNELVIRNAIEHNLKNVTISIPLGTLTAVTGVSGSGKSTLIFDILDREAKRYFFGSRELAGKCGGIEGFEHISSVITIDQCSMGRTPRSNTATYTDAFNYIRKAFAASPVAKQARIPDSFFSFNVPGGRCEKCSGAGTMTVSMHFLPDVQVKCPVCHGRRYKKQVLDVKYKGFNISDVLDMTILEAMEVFRDEKPVYSRLALMDQCGIGFLKLGQPATTLSGGEAQRIKLARELGKKRAARTLYLLDEPTTGLHPSDTLRLIKVLTDLVEAGNTVVVLEHNLEVIQCADWVIDMGPEGGAGGGRVIAEGRPEEVAEQMESFTGHFLKKVLKLKN